MLIVFLNSCQTLKHHRFLSKKGETEKTVHIMMTVADHWEPGWKAPQNTEKAKMWLEDYPAVASKHHDADGVMPQHTWFCANIEKPTNHLQVISKACFNELGEMEIHIHHDGNKTEEINTKEMSDYIDSYLAKMNRYGACLTTTTKPKAYFGFVHGIWALDNSFKDTNGIRRYCGINNEIDLLISKGCYADFTLPYYGGTQGPYKWKDKIMITKDSPEPASYDMLENIREVAFKGERPKPNELLLIPGPSTDSNNIDWHGPRTLDRMKKWIKANIHVKGKDNWIFIKLYTHSSQVSEREEGRSAFVGEVADKFFTDIEREFNDGSKYQLHYVSAREMYNIIIAASDGKTGNPNQYRDYAIEKPANKRFYCDNEYKLLSFDKEKGIAEFEILDNQKSLSFLAKDFNRSDIVLERGSLDEKPRRSDGKIIAKDNLPFVFYDPSPSKYYIFQKKPTMIRHHHKIKG